MKRAIYIGTILFAFTLASRPTLAQNTGPELFKAKCEMCHGADGLSNTPLGKALGGHPYNAPEVLKLTDAQLTDIIKQGKNKMPPFGTQLTDAQIKSILPYIHSLQKKK